MSLKKIFFVIIYMGIFINSITQNQNPISDIFPPSPNAMWIGFFAKNNVNMHIGAPDIQIPLYLLGQGSMQVPITLQYNSTGVKPNERTSWVGLGWSLNAGGVITREVKETPDEEFTGFFNNASLPIDISNEVSSGSTSGTYLSKINYDTQADLFYFNFNGYSGKFFCSNETYDPEHPVFYTVPHYNFKIDYALDKQSGEDRINEITITTDDGFKYVFGSSTYYAYTNPQVDGPVEYAQEENSVIERYSVAWYLTKIISPVNNQTINFYYKALNPENKIYLALNYSKFTRSSYGGFSTYAGDNKGFLNRHPTSMTFFNSGIIESKSITFRKYLSRIETDDEIAEFNFSDYSFLLYEPENSEIYTNNFDIRDQKLDNIIIKNKITNEEVKRFTFCYDASTHRLALRNINITAGSETNSYNLDYYNLYNLPTKLTDRFDHWNYLISPAPDLCSNVDLEPLVYFNEQGLEIREETSRGPDLSLTGIGMLKRIDYPTGGFTTYEYQQNTYDSYFLRTNYGYRFFSGVQNAYAGGVRVWKITDDDGSGKTITKEYQYSGGILSELPIYRYNVTGGLFGVAGSVLSYHVNQSVPMNRFGSTFGSSIGYSKVTEIKSDGSKIETSYTNFLENPDELTGLTTLNYYTVDGIQFSMGTPFSYMAPVSSWEQDRGLPLKIVYYNNSGPVKEIQYTYSHWSQVSRYESATICLFKGQNIPEFSGGGGGGPGVLSNCYSYYYLFNYPYLQTKVETWNYFGTESIYEKTEFTYSWDGYYHLKSASGKTSKDETKTITYTYPNEYQTSPHTEMTSNNITGRVVSVSESIASVKTKEKFTEFYDVSKYYLPKWEKNWLEGTTYDIDIIYDYYNPKGFIQQYRKDDYVTTILYAYNNSLPVAKIDHLGLTSINSAFVSSLGSLTANSEISTRLNNLQNTFPDYFMTTYLYDVNNKKVIQEKLPNKISLLYEYDNWGRLIRKKDNNGNILLEAGYHIKNTAFSNTCPSYPLRLKVTYDPPAQGPLAIFCKITDGNGREIQYGERIICGNTYQLSFTAKNPVPDCGFILCLVQYDNPTNYWLVSGPNYYSVTSPIVWIPNQSLFDGKDPEKQYRFQLRNIYYNNGNTVVAESPEMYKLTNCP